MSEREALEPVEVRPSEGAADLALANRRAQRFAAIFALSMMAAALALPFLSATRELSPGLTILQLTLLGLFCFCWMYLGDAAEKAGRGLSFSPKAVSAPRAYSSPTPCLIYLLVFAPSGFAYVYVAYQNTGYLGFNYVLLFIVAGFSAYFFPLWLVLVFLVAETVAWAGLAWAMWDNWLPVGDLISTFAGYLFSAMMFFLLGKERVSRAKAEALSKNLDTANEKLREYSGQVEELAATQERNRIAREIHDTLGHSLTVVNMQLETARALIERDPQQATAFLEKAQAMTKRGLADIRGSVASLRASPLNGQSLEEGLESLLEATRASGVRTELRRRGDLQPLSLPVKSALYRSAQEGLTNVCKHAQASQVILELDYTRSGEVGLTLRDDGVGCERPSGGFGITGIRERIQLLDGEARVETAPGKGLTLSITLKR